MVFSSIIFLFAFLPTVIGGYYILFRKNRKWQNKFLFVCSVVFYSWGGIKYTFLLLGTILINWLFGLTVQKNIEKEQDDIAKYFVALSVIANVTVLFVFKYFNFFVDNVEAITGKTFNMLEIALPIGISFFTFQAMSYVIDVYRRRADALQNPLDVGLYISFFPQLIAGPIVRYESVAEQIYNRKESFDKFFDGICRFSFGLGKKVILSNTLAIVAKTAFEASDLSMCMAWLGVLAYTLQIYFDFSGYSDMAIGLGKMFGFEFAENFNYPYISSSITEFWRRWHISMGTWFRDYVYFPLGGSRVKTKARMHFNLFVVWLLTGFWHGANWTFVVWGLLHFVVICIEKIFRKKDGVNFVVKCFAHIYTIIIVMIGWVFFNSVSIGQAIQYLSSMLILDGNLTDTTFFVMLSENWFELIVGIILCMPVCQMLSGKIREKNIDKHDLLRICAAFGILFISVTYMAKGSYNPFIYFNF